MTTLILNNTSPGAPALSGTNGALCDVLDWALVQNGWTIEHTAANARVYRPGSGHRRRLWVAHDSAISGKPELATARGCEDATAATFAALVDPFPTPAQLWHNASAIFVSTSAGAAARAYTVIVGVASVTLIVCAAGGVEEGTYFFFGDTAPTHAGDLWNTVIGVYPNAYTTGINQVFSGFVQGFAYIGNRFFFARSIDGVVKSSRAVLAIPGVEHPGGQGQINGLPAARGGYEAKVMRMPAGLTCQSTSSLAVGAAIVVNRAWVPHLWLPLHNGAGGMIFADTFKDAAYNPAAEFRALPAAGAWVIIETSDTWVPPNG